MRSIKIETTRKVKYRVTEDSESDFQQPGEIHEAFLIAKESGRALLYLPKPKGKQRCACFEICCYVGNNTYEALNPASFVNYDPKHKKVMVREEK